MPVTGKTTPISCTAVRETGVSGQSCSATGGQPPKPLEHHNTMVLRDLRGVFNCPLPQQQISRVADASFSTLFYMESGIIVEYYFIFHFILVEIYLWSKNDPSALVIALLGNFAIHKKIVSKD